MNREKPKEQLYKIGMFSKMNRITVKALRYYDEIGLLKPCYIDDWNGYRYYSSSQLPTLHQIIALRDMGFSLEDIKQIQEGSSPETLIKKKKQEILAEIAAKTSILAQLEVWELQDRNDDYHVIVKELPEITVASMRTIIPGYEALFGMIPTMNAEIERLGVAAAEPPYCFSVYHDGEYKEEEIDAEVCEAVAAAKGDSELVRFKILPRVEYALSVLHKGAYKDFPKAYAAIIHFAEANGYEVIDLPRESYIDGIWNKEREEEWLSEIQLPVRKIE